LNVESLCLLGSLRSPDLLDSSLKILSDSVRGEAEKFLGATKQLPRAELIQRWVKKQRTAWACSWTRLLQPFGCGWRPGWSINMDEKILKADSVADKVVVSNPKVLKREVFEAAQEARDVVSVAQDRARQIIAQAERESEEIREKAREEGKAQGLAEWNRILAQASKRAEELTKSWEETMLRLSVRVAEKIVGEQLRLHPDTIVEIVREVLKNVRPGKRLAIQVHPSEAQRVRARVDRLRESLGASSEIEIVAAASVPAGGCVIDSELGIIDARLETQLKCLEEVLVRGISGD